MRNIFESEAEALVNPVNCEGIMGGGLALEFRKKFPAMFNEYRTLCDRGELEPGIMHVWKGWDKFVINFPTKDELYKDSELEYIEVGLPALIKACKEHGIKSVAVPALGSGLGRLDWGQVKPLILKAFEDSGIELDLYDPQ